MHQLQAVFPSLPLISSWIPWGSPELPGSVSQWYTSSSITIRPEMLKLLLSRMAKCPGGWTTLERSWVANTTLPFFQRVTDGVTLTGRSRHGSTMLSPNSLIIVISLSVDAVGETNEHVTAGPKGYMYTLWGSHLSRQSRDTPQFPSLNIHTRSVYGNLQLRGKYTSWCLHVPLREKTVFNGIPCPYPLHFIL